MSEGEAETPATMRVAVVNHEGQYSIWPADRPLPPGWTEAGIRGTEQDCLAFIERTWVDMRPLSLRRELAPAKSKLAGSKPTRSKSTGRARRLRRER